jgi:hypothetical protein
MRPVCLNSRSVRSWVLPVEQVVDLQQVHALGPEPPERLLDLRHAGLYPLVHTLVAKKQRVGDDELGREVAGHRIPPCRTSARSPARARPARRTAAAPS